MFGIHSKKVVTPESVREAVVLIEGSTISGVISRESVPDGVEVLDVGNQIVMPGLVDSHVHVNEPGRTEWEGFESATRSAAAGGITTIADMPLNSNPVTTSAAAFEQKLQSTVGKLYVDCAFLGGVVPGNSGELVRMIEAGVAGFKCFLIHSGIDDFPNVTESDLHTVMPMLARHSVPLMVHAELDQKHAAEANWSSERSYRSFLRSRPRDWEDDAIGLMIKMAKQYKCRVHIVHLSSSNMLPHIKAAAGRGVHITAETCPHYLTFAAEDIPDGDCRFKCTPPIRERENREQLWSALKDGVIDIIVSDHSPCTPDLKFLKEGDLKRAWGGVSSLQFRLPVVWTEARRRGFTLHKVCRWLCSAPAELLGMQDHKGKIKPGYDADIVVWDPDGEVMFKSDNIFHKHKVTPYEGRRMQGVVKRTYLRGQLIYQDGNFVSNPRGKPFLCESAAV